MIFWGGVGTNERPGTDHVTSGPIKGLGKKLHPMAQTNRQTHRHPGGHGDSMTETAHWGQFSEIMGNGHHTHIQTDRQTDITTL